MGTDYLFRPSSTLEVDCVIETTREGRGVKGERKGAQSKGESQDYEESDVTPV